MHVAKWGNSLAVRLPADLVRKLGLRAGDEINIRADDAGLQILRKPRPEEVLEALQKFRGKLNAEDRLSRDEAHAR
ncbi:AbrB/MazE/SpoVT family DNA-binding domain-containing protein [Pseudothioclava nitratireducens]|uniref:AbrB/MazE/SpoVT family DNA-binding domain-containing protein n=1 Tax=Pseudothioclava nitratireducens TaxID=1928646 RepID=UPI0023DBE0B2|nr:AbrB/MazE/SpoVT family DNA-binding domain-containing protein [Defluviimonas nitratireducens]MDF1621814.1 AbrB/MazE/SpoVT family DNA-binding domain-containing protein [Defluviimonas nitratireducens]